MVLASVSGFLRKLLKQAERDLNRQEAQVVLHLPEFKYREVKPLVDFIYSNLALPEGSLPESVPGLEISPEITSELRIPTDFLGYKSRSDVSAVCVKRKYSDNAADDDEDEANSDEEGGSGIKRPKVACADQPYKCKICGKSFVKKPILVKHERKCYQANKSANISNIKGMIEACEGTLEYVKV